MGDIRKVSVGRWFFYAIAIFGAFVVIGWIAFRAEHAPTGFEEKRVKARLEKLDALHKEDDGKLAGYAWVAKDKGVAQIPIDRAMELVMAELKSKPVQASAVPVDNPYPYGWQAPPAVPAASGPQIGTNPSASPAPGAPNTQAPELKKP